MAQSTTGFSSRRTDKLTLSRSQIEEVFREAIPSLRIGKGAEATGLCPFHDDKNPSFSVDLDEGLWNCHAKCGGGNIYQFVARIKTIDIKDVDHYLQRRFGMTETVHSSTKPRQIIRQYHWVDDNGREAWKHRWSSGGKFSWSQDKENRLPGQGECQPTLYLLPALETVSKVIMVEGERDAETVNEWLRNLGITDTLATCTPNGAADVKPAYVAPVCGKAVVWVSGDNDDPGEKYLERWGLQLQSIVTTVNRLAVPSGHKDWTEWQDGGGTAEKFRDLLGQSPLFTPRPKANSKIEFQEVKADSEPVEVAEVYLADMVRDEEGMLRLCRHRNQWYGYDGRIFSRMEPQDLQDDVVSFLHRTPAKAKIKKGFVSDVLLSLSAQCRLGNRELELPVGWIPPVGWVSVPKCVAVQNGIVDLEALFAGNIPDGFMNFHTARFVSTVCLPFKYDPDARCSRWESFLVQVLPDPDSRQLLQEIFGYCLTYDTSQQKFFMFEGSGANGKGVVLRVLESLLGKENVSALTLEAFSGRHDLVATLGKLVNITGDVGELDKVGEGLLKQFTGEDTMHFNPKYLTPFSAKATARLILSTNVRPPFRDRSDGIWRRLVLVPFPVTIPEQHRNPHLTEELVTELSGIFNWAVLGAWDLHKRGGFIEPKACQVAQEAFRREANPARVFLEETYEAQPEGEVGKQAVYERYKANCLEQGYKPLNAHTFTQEVQLAFPQVNITKPRRAGGRERMYKGIALKRGGSSDGREVQESIEAA